MKSLIEKSFQTFRSVMVQMPTGTGKTHLLAAVIDDYVGRDKQCVVWIVAHRKELVSQIERTIEQFGMAVNHQNPARCRVQVYSIQWLSRHLEELMAEGVAHPDLIVIDEAHHAVAKTYAAVMNAFPLAKNLGLTATPCRLNGKGFTDLFNVLLFCPSIYKFIKRGYLSTFDYISIPSGCDEAVKIDALEKRSADGDYNIAEMSDVLDCRPSIERLYKTVVDYATGKKGIVYAINIEHAEHIATYYSEHGLKACAISSKTSESERVHLLADFVAGRIQILVNVDIFSEGFDCPDVDFIQMARPTLSLAKYLQQVGRGLRVAPGKVCCLLLDNVGLYRFFGLPTVQWDWEAMFFGELRGKGEIDAERVAYLDMMAEGRYAESFVSSELVTDDSHTDMVLLACHERMEEQMMLFDLVRGLKESFANMKLLKRGWLLERHLVMREMDTSSHDVATVASFSGATAASTNGSPVLKVFTFSSESHLGWRLAKDDKGIFYTFHYASEQLVRVGSHHPWARLIQDSLRVNTRMTDGMPPKGMLRLEEYINVSRVVAPDGVRLFDGLYGLVDCSNHFVVLPDYVELSKAVDGVRSFKTVHGDCGIMSQDGDYELLWNLSSAKLLGDGLAYVKERVARIDNKPTGKWSSVGASAANHKVEVRRGHWVNLFTMQEFETQPVAMRCGPVTLLRVGEVFYFQKFRYLAGVALHREDFVYNDDVFQFMHDYVVLKQQPSKVFSLGRKLTGGDIAESRYLLQGVGFDADNDKGVVRMALLPKMPQRVFEY